MAIRQKYGNTPAIFVSKMNPATVQSNCRKLGIKTAKTAYLSESISLAKVNKAYGRDSVLIFIQAWIENLADFMGFSEEKKPTPSFLHEVSELFYENAYFLKVSEMGYFFNNLKRGVYGQFYGNLDPQKLLIFLDAFLTERFDAVRQINNEATRSNRNNDEIAQQIKDYYQTIRNKKALVEKKQETENLENFEQEFGITLKKQNGQMIVVKDNNKK